MSVHYVIDCESDGPCPGVYSLISIGVVSIVNGSIRNKFYGETKPISTKYDPVALSVSGYTRVQHETFELDGECVFNALFDWIENHRSIDTKHIVWSDNPAYDWQWPNYYFHRFVGSNPWGFSARRIGDFAAGLSKNVWATNQWKKLRQTKHTHNALDDAIGNAEALITLCKQNGIQL